MIIPAVAILIWLMRKDFIRFKEKSELEEYRAEKKWMRRFMLATRILIFSFLIIALASPFAVKTITLPGDALVTLLVDNSTSMSMFNLTEIESLQKELKKEMPVSLRYISTDDKSAIGDALLNNMQGNDNILVISDGNNNDGRNLGDMLVFASSLNSTINAFDIKPIQNDAAVSISGQSEVLVDTDNSFAVDVDVIGDVGEYSLKAWVDGKEVMSKKSSKSISEVIITELPEGYHKIKAEIDSDDFIKENNIFYKTVNVLPKPNVAFISKNSAAPMWQIVGRSYKGELFDYVPNLERFHAIIIDDFSFPELKQDLPKLEKYVEEGNGIVFVGGKNSYDKGGYKDTELEQILPSRVGYGALNAGSKLNVVVVIDVSLSTGISFGSGSSNTKVDIEKSIAVGVINSLRPKDNAGVIAFNWDAYVVSELSPMYEKPYLNRTISKLQYVGGTRIFTGLQKALAMLRFKEGSRNVVLISDGRHSDTNADRHTINYAASLAEEGIKLYTIGVGKDTNEELMKQLAETGKGAYYKPSEFDRLEIVFGRARGNESKANELIVVEPNHFITQNINLSGYLSGFNFVLPKSSARVLVSTAENNPIITSWRYGLGMVISMSTDDGFAWSGDMFNKHNSKIITRMINYAVGDPERKKEFYVKVEDTRVNAETQILVFSKKLPSYKGYNFTKTDTDTYETAFKSSSAGFNEFAGTIIAVNYPKEYKPLGFNPELESLISVTGGKIFGLDETENLIEKIKNDSKREVTEPVYLRWPFVIAAIAALLTEIFVRMIRRYQKA